MVKIISGSSHRDLTNSLASILEIKFVDVVINKFADEEIRIQIKSNLNHENVIILQSTSKPANDNLMELMLLVDAVKRASANKVIAVIPYFGYSRQDRPSYNYGPISARLVATLLESSGIDYIITIDMHSEQSEGFFKIPMQNIDSTELFLQKFNQTIDIPNEDIVVVSPDVGGLNRARKLAKLMNCDVAVIDKYRDNEIGDNKCNATQIIGNVRNKHCIIVDDIIDTGNTILKALELLEKNNILSTIVYGVHCVLSNNAAAKLQKSNIKKIFMTNTIAYEKKLPEKFEIIEISELIKKALEWML